MNLPSDPLVGSSPLFSPISVPSHTSIDFLHALPLDNPLAARVGVARRSVSLGDPKNPTNDPQPKKLGNPHQGTCWRLPLHWFHTATAATLFIIATAAISATASWLWLTDREQPPHIDITLLSQLVTLKLSQDYFCKKHAIISFLLSLSLSFPSSSSLWSGSEIFWPQMEAHPKGQNQIETS